MNFFVGFLSGVLFCIILGLTVSKAANLKEKCEADLPRSESCTMIYVPEKSL